MLLISQNFAFHPKMINRVEMPLLNDKNYDDKFTEKHLSVEPGKKLLHLTKYQEAIRIQVEGLR